jgi:hypothetical protein
MEKYAVQIDQKKLEQLEKLAGKKICVEDPNRNVPMDEQGTEHFEKEQHGEVPKKEG